MLRLSHDTLFPDGATRHDTFQWIEQSLQTVLERIASGSVSPSLDIEMFRTELQRYDFAAEGDLKPIAQWVLDQLSSGVVQMTHRGYFGLFNPAPTFPSECADLLASAVNPQVGVWSHAPAAVEIERHTLQAVAQRIGFDAQAAGHFTSGGSEANRAAVLCALTAANFDFGEKGASAFTGQPRLYASRESHLAWLKIAHEVGIGRSAVCLVDTDGRGRMDSQALANAVDRDCSAGAVPFFIACTAGTTNAGVVDPILECRQVADHFGLWMHTDAAWGGALIASDTLRTALAGLETSDSVTIDAHKWFATTMGTGMFLTRRPKLLHQVFNVQTDYMPSNDHSVDWYVTSSQWSRRFIGLRLFLSLAVAGWPGYARHVERAVDLANYLCVQVEQLGWRVANESQMAVACLVPPPGSVTPDQIVERVVTAGQHWISVTRFEHQPVIRVCITNGKTTQDDVDSLVDAMAAAAAP